MNTDIIYSLTTTDLLPIGDIGGKAFSLIEGTKYGLPVPQGFILSVAFFQPWFQAIKQSSEWKKFHQPRLYNMQKSCDSLKKYALSLPLTTHQKQSLQKALEQYPDTKLFAVRSSSPEEDMEGVSFAGGYESVLGINKKNLTDAIKKTFISCLDYRVVVYKKEHGFNIYNPKIAVIVQEQIASEIAGVGFSLNPVTNNFDEAVITANWGLGETVVSGEATPDTYTVDKISYRLQNKQLGAKETAIWLLPDGGTKKEKLLHSNKNTLSDNHVVELTKLIKKVETFFEQPMDIEWAYVKNKLYLLQARPITTYVPLSEPMLTKPGENKRLYIDFTLSLQGINKPISVVGTSFFIILIQVIGKLLFFRDMTRDITSAIPWISPGRMYLNLSNLLKIISKKKIVAFLSILDPLAAKTFHRVNEKIYTSKANKLHLLPIGVIRFAPKIALHVLSARKSPKDAHRKSQQILAGYMIKAREISEKDLPLVAITHKLLRLAITDVFLNTPPLYITGREALKEMKKLAGEDLEKAFAPLEVALPNNVTTEMGLALYGVAKLIPTHVNKKNLLEGIKNRTVTPALLSSWDHFMAKYGFRGPLEIDLAASRYQDNPELLISILLSLRDSSKHNNPEEKFRRNQENGRKAYEYIYHAIERKNKIKAVKFQKQYDIYETFGGYRESHKFYFVYALNLLRQRILQEALLLYNAGRLDSIYQIFDLRLNEIDKAKLDVNFNLKNTAKKNKIFIDRLARIQNLPTLIDSRGLILRPKKVNQNNNEISGTPISPGIVRGKIKVLHSPDEKPFLKGEILVARATDPGWTPLFATAGAVILEIGGVLQHGALVAREYGLPCIAGVENATNLWQDGTIVEVNGSEGTIKNIS